MRNFIERGYLIIDSSGKICEIYIGSRKDALEECEKQSIVINNLDTFSIKGNSIPVYSIIKGSLKL